MDVLEIKRHKLIIERCSFLIECLHESESVSVKELKDRSQKLISNHNEDNRVVVDVTLTELGNFRSSCKKMIKPKYKRFANDYLNKLVDETKFCEKIQNSFILLNRRCSWDKRGSIERAIFLKIRTDILNEFFNQNKQNL